MQNHKYFITLITHVIGIALFQSDYFDFAPCVVIDSPSIPCVQISTLRRENPRREPIQLFILIYSYFDTIPYQQKFFNKVDINIHIKKFELLFQGVVFASLYLNNSLNLTLKKLNEAESRICLGSRSRH